MKRRVASRKLKRICATCGCQFKKGDVYYIRRSVFVEDSSVYAYEDIQCPKCKYHENRSRERFQNFKKRCTHPEKFQDEVWSYILGEAVMQPDHDVCLLCGEWV